jgi:hypothetical protein
MIIATIVLLMIVLLPGLALLNGIAEIQRAHRDPEPLVILERIDNRRR